MSDVIKNIEYLDENIKKLDDIEQIPEAERLDFIKDLRTRNGEIVEFFLKYYGNKAGKSGYFNSFYLADE